LWTTLVAAAADDAAAPRNHLAGESSPYLLQHAGNPVDWHPWGPAALAKAQRENKLVFLSSGYHACHWCHVMERESFTNPAVAALLNEHFVCIKVDREERPEVDHVYLTALNVMGQRGGWPLSMFLTADGKPIAGGTYWPPDDREIDGETVPGFLTVLKAVIDFHRQAPDDIRRTADLRADQTRRALSQRRFPPPAAPSHETVQAAVTRLEEMFDPLHGGFGQPPEFAGPKFPRPPQLQLLQHEAARNKSAALKKIAQTTLEQMARGGIYDQIGGGFHRYSTERTWTVPHFEKMLSDNAQLLELYAAAHAESPQPLYRRVLEDTLAFVDRELTSPDGVFYTSLDADVGEDEGRYYVWTADELAAALPNAADRAFLQPLLGLDDPANFEGSSWILRQPQPLAESDVPRFSRLQRQLLAARANRPRPNVDTKVLTSWNGLMIAGMARAGQTLDDRTAIDRASRAADFLLRTVRTEDGRLMHVYAAAPGEPPKSRIEGYLDDYTHLVHGLLALHDVTGEARWLAEAQRLTETMVAQFHDPDQGGYYFTAPQHDALFVRIKDQNDGVQPSGNSQAALNFVRLWQATGEPRFRDQAEQTIQALAGPLEDQPSGLCGLLRALAELNETPQP
jgi:uncharacterized protein